MENQIKSEKDFQVLIAIPAFNEETRINQVLEKVGDYKNQLIFVDDGSTDRTGWLIENSGFSCIRHKLNLGLTQFYNTVLKYAIENGYTHLLTLDSDGQHRPEYIGEFIERLRHFDMVVGNRFHEIGKVPVQKLASNFFATQLLRKVIGQNLPDVACGFRAMKIESVFGNYKIQSFGVVYDLLIRYAMTSKPLTYVNIPVVYNNDVRLVTNIVEIVSLINVVRQYINLPELEKILILMEKRRDFKLKLFNFHFNAIYSEPMAYVFQTDQNKALQYYSSIHL
jgi:glycosyltransferase involved in cell wall biosynthesis